MAEINPSNHNEFHSYSGSLKIKIPFVIDEHEVTGVTILTVKIEGDLNNQANVQIIVSGPLKLKDKGGKEETNQITKIIMIPGNDVFHIQSPQKYEYPPGKEGDCLAQASILLRKIEKVNNVEVAVDSLYVDLYIKRKLANVLKSMWKNINTWLTGIASSTVITAVISLVAYFLGNDVSLLVPSVFIVSVASLGLLSVLYSWYIRDKIIKKRLECNPMYQQLVEHLTNE